MGNKEKTKNHLFSFRLLAWQKKWGIIIIPHRAQIYSLLVQSTEQTLIIIIIIIIIVTIIIQMIIMEQLVKHNMFMIFQKYTSSSAEGDFTMSDDRQECIQCSRLNKSSFLPLPQHFKANLQDFA